MAARKQDIKKLVDWAETYNYQVIFDKTGTDDICFETKTIEICSTKSSKEKILILAHECGHIMNTNRMFPYPKNSVGERKKTNRLWDEMSAWIEARKLLISLDIVFDEKKLSSHAAKCLANYLLAFSTQDEI